MNIVNHVTANISANCSDFLELCWTKKIKKQIYRDQINTLHHIGVADVLFDSEYLVFLCFFFAALYQYFQLKTSLQNVDWVTYLIYYGKRAAAIQTLSLSQIQFEIQDVQLDNESNESQYVSLQSHQSWLLRCPPTLFVRQC